MFTWGVIRGVRTPVCYALSLQNKWKSFTTCRSSVYRVGKTLSFYSQKAINWDLDFAFKNFKFILHFCIYCILYVVYSMFWHAQCTPVQLLYILSLTPWNLDLDAFPVSFFIRHSFSKRRFEPCLHHRQELSIKLVQLCAWHLTRYFAAFTHRNQCQPKDFYNVSCSEASRSSFLPTGQLHVFFPIF